MTTTIPATAATGTAIVPAAPPTTPGPIIVASDGATGSEPALLAARLLAARFHAPVQLVSVVTPRARRPRAADRAGRGARREPSRPAA